MKNIITLVLSTLFLQSIAASLSLSQLEPKHFFYGLAGACAIRSGYYYFKSWQIHPGDDEKKKPFEEIILDKEIDPTLNLDANNASVGENITKLTETNRKTNKLTDLRINSEKFSASGTHALGFAFVFWGIGLNLENIKKLALK